MFCSRAFSRSSFSHKKASGGAKASSRSPNDKPAIRSAGKSTRVPTLPMSEAEGTSPRVKVFVVAVEQ